MEHSKIDSLTVRDLGDAADERGVSAVSLMAECEPQHGS